MLAQLLGLSASSSSTIPQRPSVSVGILGDPSTSRSASLPLPSSTASLQRQFFAVVGGGGWLRNGRVGNVTLFGVVALLLLLLLLLFFYVERGEETAPKLTSTLDSQQQHTSESRQGVQKGLEAGPERESENKKEEEKGIRRKEVEEEQDVGQHEQQVVLFFTKIHGEVASEARPELVRTHHNCSPYNCTMKITTERSFYEHANAVMFNSEDIDWTLVPSKLPHQVWILYSELSPLRDPNLRNEARMNKFELSARYRLQDNNVVYVPFGRDIQLPGPPPRISVGNKSDLAPVVWISNEDCHAPNRRERYVHELMRHIGVHSYGSCLNNQPWPKKKRKKEKVPLKDDSSQQQQQERYRSVMDDLEGVFGSHSQAPSLFFNREGMEAEEEEVEMTWEEVVSQYKFVLVFEDANCKDYVSREFWKAIELGVVPVVMGAPNIDDFSPTFHSVIKTIDYLDPLQLAEQLNLLNHNDSLYLQYIDYKYDSTLLKPRFLYYLRKFHYQDPWCELCHILRTQGESLARERPRGHPDMTCQNKWGILNQIRGFSRDDSLLPPTSEADEGDG
jgi:hypothetical protein